MPRHPRTASRGEQLKDSVFQALVRRASTHDGPVFPLHVGDSWREPPPAARAEALVTETHPGLHRYALPQGEPALLDAIVERLGVHAPVERKQVQVVSGATVGLSITCQALLDPGDEVLLPSPYWPLIRGIIASASATPVEIPFFTRLDEDDLDAEALLEAAVTERTTAIYLNSPHNPTGHVPSEAVLSAIARVAERHDLWVFCDEVYERLCYLDPQPAPTWSRDDLRHRAVATHSVSKSHALAGARVGWTHGPEEAMSALRKVQAHQVYCASRPMQAAALAALTEGESWLSEARSQLAETGARTARALNLPEPAGGTFLFFDASPWLDGGDDALPLLERCLDAGLLLTPGASCGRDYASWVRLCFSNLPPDQMDEATTRLSEVLSA